MATIVTPSHFHPAVALDAAGHLRAARPLLYTADELAAGLEFAAIAIDEVGEHLFAGAPAAWQRRLLARLERALARPRRSGRFASAAATVLLDLAEGSAVGSLRRSAIAASFALLARARNPRLRESMVANLDRARKVLDAAERAHLTDWWRHLVPQRPPYAGWFAGDNRELRIVCQVQDVYFTAWQWRMRRLGFRGHEAGGGAIRFTREVRVGRRVTSLRMDYLRKGEGIFTAMQDPEVHVVMFLGHSDWWARVPRNLAHAPDQHGDKLLVLIMCFGKHFYHALHERYPAAHIITSKDPTEDPEDQALLQRLFAGIAARRSWHQIRRAADPVTEENFIFPGDSRYVAGVLDSDRDGRLDRHDRYCNLAGLRLPEPASPEESFLPDPLELHPRGVELNPREIDGGRVFEAALMLNSLSYDNYFLDQVNQDQRVVSGGWHLPPPGDFSAARFTAARRDGRPIVRLTASVRLCRAAQSALTAMVVYEGYQYFAAQLRSGQSKRDAALMGLVLVAHALGNAHYAEPAATFYAFLRRYGFPRISLASVVAAIEVDPNWESGSPASLRALARTLPPRTLSRLESLVDA